MKKRIAVLFITSLIGLSALISQERSFKQANATNAVYVDLGPGVFNPAQSGTPEESFRPEKYSIAYRGSHEEGAIMLFPNNDLYKEKDFNTMVPVNGLTDTNFSKIRIYTNKTSYKTIDEYLSRGSNSTYYNIYGDAAQNVSFFLDRQKLPSQNLYKISLEEGFVLPYPSNDHSTKYVLKETMTFVNRYYGVASHEDIIYSDEWTRISSSGEEEQEEEGIVLQDIAAFSRTVGKGGGRKEDYRLQIRGSDIKEEDFYIPGKLDQDDYTCRLYIYFGDNDYNPEIYGQYNIPIPNDKMDLSDSETSYLKTLYDRVLFITQEDETITLRQVSDPFTKGLPMYNASGESGCLVFNIGSFGDDSLPSYNGRSFKRITVLRDAQFPDYRYTHLESKTEYRYQQVDDISVELTNVQTLWALNALFAFNAADINITSVGTRKVNIDTAELKLNGVVLDIGLSECNYGDVVNQPILTIGENLTKYIYINGRSIYYSFNTKDIKAFANLDGKTSTISIVLPFEETNQITEIIVQRGCSIPSLVASTITMKIYGSYVSYYVLATASYALNGNSYQETAEIYWTLWFDGKNPIRVENNKTFDFSENAPVGDNTDRQRFVKWINESGESIVGFKRINDMSSKEFFGVYIYSQFVEFKNIEKEFSVKVDRFTRLTTIDKVKDILIPKKKGYTFQGWVDEEGNHYNIDNRVTRDLVLTATWISNSEISGSTSQNNNLNVLSIVTISLASVAGIVLIGDLILFLLLKKKSKK